ncbi:MAG: lyase family protein [Candidatus Aenigmatarchaeota archaeon]|nr:hypothetical protein [Nanoarchaeota archaeon]
MTKPVLERTEPKHHDIREIDSARLSHGRYGTDEMCGVGIKRGIWGDEATFQYSLDSQAASIETIREVDPDFISAEITDELVRKAKVDVIGADVIRAIEADTGHDVIAINRGWNGVVSPEAGRYINKFRASACTTVTTQALQIRDAIRTIIDSGENLRDITLERAYLDWSDKPSIDLTHLNDALSSHVGRPFAFYAETLQFCLEELKRVHDEKLYGKWSDATGNFHEAKASGFDGPLLQELYCKKLGLQYMDASAQVPSREMLTLTPMMLSLVGQSVGNLAHNVRFHRGDDSRLFTFPLKKKGSSSMPQKDLKGGNQTAEEQAEGFARYMIGPVAYNLSTCIFDYARDLVGSAPDRIYFDDMFKFGDHVIRRMADVMSKLILDEERAKERIDRSYGVTTSRNVMTHLTDARRTDAPLTWDEAHEIAAELATTAFRNRTPYADALLADDRINSRFDEDVIRDMSDPAHYTGESRKIIETVFGKYHGKRMFD